MQGFNMGRYYPPDSDNPPTFNKTHPLGTRARKLRSEGILTVRFEMPFPIWCSHCPKPTIIGQGVRFNAEKKKVGNYYSTPIWSFRMKHVICGGEIEIRTDPKASEYVVSEGAKRRDYGDEKVEEGVLDEEERARRREDAMAGLEGRKEEEGIKLESSKRVEELLEDRERHWADPYEANRMVRKGFRRERKERVREREKAEGIQDKLALGIDLVPENEEDRLRAGMVDFGQTRLDGAVEAASRPFFERDATKPRKQVASPKTSLKKASKDQSERKTSLEQRLVSSTRAAVDPWRVEGTSRFSTDRKPFERLKRRDEDVPIANAIPGDPDGADVKHPVTALVAYDSD
ncbi:CWC16 protein [Elsinoe ampelina]|uniref:CWC16 protein n=1 Tax=Elsinoe ampelina TaxID=302913 RepID=A0A6A6GP33_9PEZI|nr:CWC16 protein [Elsinoe ampelina]